MAGSELGDAMTKKPSTEGGLEVAAVKSEYRLTLPDGSTLQMIGARASQLALLFQNQKRSPTLEEFGQVFILEAKAERQKPSHVDGKQSILRHHLLPVLGATLLDSIGHPEVMRLKASLAGRSSKTVNNVDRKSVV